MSSWVPPADRPPVPAMADDALMAELVTDAVLPFATPIVRFMHIVNRIAAVRRISIEDVYQVLLDEVESLTGVRGLPIG